jgi:hypothetical protein
MVGSIDRQAWNLAIQIGKNTKKRQNTVEFY